MSGTWHFPSAESSGMSVGVISGEDHPVEMMRNQGRLEVQTFGCFRIVDSRSMREIHFRSRKALALLCYFAVATDHALTRERAMELLWGSRGEEQARASLRQILHEIRSSPVGEIDAIEIGRHHLSARSDAVDTDLDEMVRLAENGEVAVLAQRMADCPDRMFEGLDGIDPAFDDWLRVERERQLLRLNQAIVTACGGDAGRDPGACRAIVSALQRLNPCDEAVARLGFELDHASGDLAALHQRYRWLEAALRRDLDAEPSELTRETFRKLIRVAPILSSAADAPAAAQAAPPPMVATAMAVEPPILTLSPFDFSSRVEEERVLATVLFNELEFALSGLTDLRLLSIGDASQASLSALTTESLSAYTLKGSLRLDGDALHLGWRLARVRDGLVLWTHRTKVARDELGAVLENIIARVAGAVLPTLERDIESGPIDAEATSGYSLYLQGRARVLSARTLFDMEQAAELFERAIELAPRLINAQLALARLYNTDFEQLLAGHDKGPLRRRAFQLCSRAVNVDPRSAHARARLGWCYLRRGDPVHATSQFEEALSLSPYLADCLNEIGVAFGHLGQVDRAMALLTRAFEINPFPRDDYFCDLAVLQMFRGEHASAEANFEIAHNDALHYVAFRLANRGLMGEDEGAALDELRKRFRATWIQATPPTDADLLDAIFDYIPLQRHEHREIISDGLERLGLIPRRR
jgi:DNA-binding SARP family transcriptional activator/TolB-like protein